VATAPALAGGFHFTRLMVPENVNSVRSPLFSTPRKKIIEPPARSLGGIAIALAGLVVVLLAANFVLYRQNTRSLAESLKEITAADPSRQAAGPAGAGTIAPPATGTSGGGQ